MKGIQTVREGGIFMSSAKVLQQLRKEKEAARERCHMQIKNGLRGERENGRV